MTLRALVADPTEPLAGQLREALLSAGFEVAAAGSLDAAVDVLRDEEPQVVFASISEAMVPSIFTLRRAAPSARRGRRSAQVKLCGDARSGVQA